MLISAKIRKVFHLIGFNENREELNAMNVMSIILNSGLCINAILYITNGKEAQNTNQRTRIKMLMAVKDVNFIITILLFTLEYGLASSNIKNLISIIDKDFTKFGADFPKAQHQLITESKANQVNMANKTEILVYFILSFIAFLPAVVTVFTIIEKGPANVRVGDMFLPFTSWYSEKYDNVRSYVIVYLFQLVFAFYIGGVGYIILIVMSCSFQSLIIDIKLLCLDLNDVDAILVGCTDKNKYTMVLRDYTTYLIKTHQQIQTSVRSLTQNLSRLITICNQTVCFQMCVHLYSAAEAENTFERCGSGGMCVLAVLALMVYCHTGQNIVNAGEEIRTALYECSWLDKPDWFKKDLQIMMALANLELQIKPLGLYVLNLNNFTSIINAAYSYFNLLRPAKM